MTKPITPQEPTEDLDDYSDDYGRLGPNQSGERLFHHSSRELMTPISTSQNSQMLASNQVVGNLVSDWECNQNDINLQQVNTKRAVFYPSAQLRNPHIATTVEPTIDTLGPYQPTGHLATDKKEDAKILQGDSGLVIDTSGLEDSLSKKDQSYDQFNEIGDYFITNDPEEQLVDISLTSPLPQDKKAQISVIQEEETQQISSLNEVSSQKASLLSSVQCKQSKVSQIQTLDNGTPLGQEEADADFQLTKSFPHAIITSIELRRSEVREAHKDSLQILNSYLTTEAQQTSIRKMDRSAIQENENDLQFTSSPLRHKEEEIQKIDEYVESEIREQNQQNSFRKRAGSARQSTSKASIYDKVLQNNQKNESRPKQRKKSGKGKDLVLTTPSLLPPAVKYNHTTKHSFAAAS